MQVGCAAAVPLWLDTTLLNYFQALNRAVAWGVPCSFLVTGAIAAERNDKLPSWSFGLLLGDASYAMYLFHTFAIAAVGILVQRLPLEGPLQLLMMLGGSIVAATAASIIVHKSIEQPILRRLNRSVVRAANSLAAP